MSSMRTIAPHLVPRSLEGKTSAKYDASIFSQIKVPRAIIGNIWRNYKFLLLWERMMGFYKYQCAGCGAHRDNTRIHPDLVIWSPFPNSLICPARLQPMCANCVRKVGETRTIPDLGTFKVGRMKGIDHRIGGWEPVAEFLGRETAFMKLVSWRVLTSEDKKVYVSPNKPQETPPFIFE